MPDVREVGLDEDLELVLHREDAVHGLLNRHDLLLRVTDRALEVGKMATSIVEECGGVQEHAEGREVARPEPRLSHQAVLSPSGPGGGRNPAALPVM
eukprot:5652944-Alexandrium_andersonii.AAC.1